MSEAEEHIAFLLKLSDEDKLEYLHQEVERIIAGARHPLKLRALQARCDKIRRTHKDPVASHVAMKSMLLEHLLDNY